MEEPRYSNKNQEVVQFSALNPLKGFCGVPGEVNNQIQTQFGVRATFQSASKEVTKPIFKKSYAQVASLVSPRVSPAVIPEAAPNSVAGLHPRPAERTLCERYGVKFRKGELELVREKAKAYHMSVNGYLRAKALGEDYIEKPPTWMRDVLLKLYAELAGQGNNLNQLARKVNMELTSAEAALGLADQQRQPLFRTLERLELALAGRRPPHDY